jgi:hypothetical protein
VKCTVVSFHRQKVLQLSPAENAALGKADSELAFAFERNDVSKEVLVPSVWLQSCKLAHWFCACELT